MAFGLAEAGNRYPPAVKSKKGIRSEKAALSPFGT